MEKSIHPASFSFGVGIRRGDRKRVISTYLHINITRIYHIIVMNEIKKIKLGE